MNHAANVMYTNTGEGDIVQLSAIQTDLYDYPSLSYSGSLKNPVRIYKIMSIWINPQE